MPVKKITGPTLRLASRPTKHSGEDAALGRPPTLRLAHVVGAQGDGTLRGERGQAQLPPDKAPALLISFWYVAPFLKYQKEYMYRDWALDSGAYSAYNSGKVIDLQEYIDQCQQLLKTDPTLTDIFALDVIGDHHGSLRNTEAMWKAGVPAIPTYHIGEPVEALKAMARDYPKIAIGGVAKKTARVRHDFAQQCFAAVWPKQIHGFGYGSAAQIMAFPFHSCDATSWEMGPCAYGRWQSFGGKMSVRGSTQNLRAEVEFYLRLERKAQTRWVKEMKLIETPKAAPVLRLAVGVNKTKRLDVLRK